ncbi:MAG: hypothetical protein JWL64_440 [Frankiales bacterium]|nr:hypothetical protein [Frankiales bacterium]
MLFALDHPFSLVVLLAAFLVCVTLNGWVTALLAARLGQRTVQAAGRTKPDPRRHVDPYGAVTAVIAGFGWSAPVDLPRRRAGQTALVLLAGPVALLLLGLGALGADGAAHGASLAVLADAVGPANLLQEGLGDLHPAVAAGEEAWFLSGLMATYVGALQLVPLPPLPGGRVLFAAAPRTLGWQKAEFQLVERNIGLVAVLVLLLLPLGGNDALLPYVLDTVLGPLLRLVSGG